MNIVWCRSFDASVRRVTEGVLAGRVRLMTSGDAYGRFHQNSEEKTAAHVDRSVTCARMPGTDACSKWPRQDYLPRYAWPGRIFVQLAFSSQQVERQAGYGRHAGRQAWATSAFYLVGGNVVQHPLLAVFFTFLVCLNLSFLSGWSIGGPLALTLIMIYTAGLNTGSPEKAAHNFIAFAFVLTWSALISLLPFWKPFPPPPVNKDLTDLDLAEQGVRLGIGSSIALAISYIAGFASSDGRQARWEMSFVSTRACQKSEPGLDFMAP